MNDNKQLAEQVVKLLGDSWTGLPGYKVIIDYVSGNLVYQDMDDKQWKMFYDWPVTGLMIDKMERLGWNLIMGYKHAILDEKSIVIYSCRFQREVNFMRTEWVSIEEQGHHIAIANAFVEAKVMIKNET